MKIILVSQREQQNQYGDAIDTLEVSYIKYFTDMGLLPIAISNLCTNVIPYFELPDICGIALTGGGSLPTAYYDKDYKYDRQPHRDNVEGALLQEALKRNVPVLGICRGMQFINGFFGGKTSRLSHLPAMRQNGCDHLVAYNNMQISVNHYHNDGIYGPALAKKLKCIARDVENNIIEAFCSVDGQILGIQWHPERSFENHSSQVITKELVYNFLIREE